MEKKLITTHFVKSPDFKTHYISGVFGGITLQGQINVMHFIERVPLPTSIDYDVDDNGNPEEIGRETKNGVVREAQGGLLLDLHQAKSIVEWLSEKINIIENQERK